MERKREKLKRLLVRKQRAGEMMGQDSSDKTNKWGLRQVKGDRRANSDTNTKEPNRRAQPGSPNAAESSLSLHQELNVLPRPILLDRDRLTQLLLPPCTQSLPADYSNIHPLLSPS